MISGGAAELDGRLRVGDQIVEIDGQPVQGAKHKQAVELIRQVYLRINYSLYNWIIGINCGSCETDTD